MIDQALMVLRSELQSYLSAVFADGEQVSLNNPAQLGSNEPNTPAIPNGVLISLVRIEEEKTLKNGPHQVRTANGIDYKNPPIRLNLLVAATAHAQTYARSLTYLSEIIRFFQAKTTFTQRNSAITNGGDQELSDDFKVIIELFSPTFEQANHIWGTMGGRQYPTAFYKVRVVILERMLRQSTGPLIKEIDLDHQHS